MPSIAVLLTLSALLLPSLAQAHEGLHHLMGFSHGATAASPLLFDLAGGGLIAGGVLLAQRMWHRPAAMRVAGLVMLVAGAGLLAA
jgi:hypothetical protein